MKFKTKSQDLNKIPAAKLLADEILELIYESDSSLEEDYAALMAVSAVLAHKLFHEGKFIVPMGFEFRKCVNHSDEE